MHRSRSLGALRGSPTRRCLSPQHHTAPSRSVSNASTEESGCVVGHNTLRFRHEDSDSESYETNTADSVNSNASDGANGMEVMDLRHSSDHVVRCMSSSSLFSFGQGLSMSVSERGMKLSNPGAVIMEDGIHEHGKIFQVVNGGKGVQTGEDTDVLPEHWQASGEATSEIDRDGERQQTHDAVISLMGSRGVYDNEKIMKRGSHCSVETSGWSALVTPRGSDVDADISTSESQSISSGSELSGLRSPDLNKRRKRGNYFLWSAKVMVGVMALALLSGSIIIYFIANNGNESISEMLPGTNYWGKLFSHGESED